MNIFKKLWSLFVKNEEQKAKIVYRPRLTERQVKVIKYLLSRGRPQERIARFMGTTQPRVSDIALGKRHSRIEPHAKEYLAISAESLDFDAYERAEDEREKYL